MHGDEFLILFSECFNTNDFDDFFSRVSGQISTKKKNGQKDENGKDKYEDFTLEGIPVKGRITLSGGIVAWFTESEDSGFDSA